MLEFSVNIYGESRERMNEFEKEIKDLYGSINSETTARDEIEKFIEITRLNFHLIYLEPKGGTRQIFLRGFIEGLNTSLRIIKNRSKQKKNRDKTSSGVSIRDY